MICNQFLTCLIASQRAHLDTDAIRPRSEGLGKIEPP